MNFVKTIFFSNFFYGICAVALSVEAALQQGVPLNNIWYYLCCFAATVLFYNYPYARLNNAATDNERSAWYQQHYTGIIVLQVCFTLLLLVMAALFIYRYKNVITFISPLEVFLLFLFPVAAALYYGGNFFFIRYNLRRFGLLKPYVIGGVWAGVVTVFPVMFYNITEQIPYIITLTGCLLFVKNFLFISLLAILFDIKDHVIDSNQQLGTLIVKRGLRITLFFIVIQLPVLAIITCINYYNRASFQLSSFILLLLPWLLLLQVTMQLRKRRSLMYYLVVIDGLLLVKALLGILSTFI